MFIDTHCHLDFPEFSQDRDEVIKSAKAQGVEYIVNVGADLAGCNNSIALAEKYDFIYAAVGIHPHDAKDVDEKSIALVRELAKKEKVVAIGEIGLDYYRNISAPDAQKTSFASFLKIAKDLNLPAIIHCREAQDDVLKIFKEAMPVSAVVHCFSGDEIFLKNCLDLGLFISFTCNITYRNADVLRNVVKACPVERIFLETDCPYLSPEGARGKRNVPANVKQVAESISQIKGVGLHEITRITTTGAKKFFKLP